MKCVRCGKKAEIVVRRHRAKFCKECFNVYFERQVERAIEEFEMFSKNERILIAVSGGKDSMVLWHVLAKLGYNVTALHINLGIERYSNDSLSVVLKMKDMVGGNLIVHDLKKAHGASLPEIVRKHKNRIPCSLCGTIKRYLLNRIAIEQDFDCVVTGHTLDDCCAFLMASVLSWDVEQMVRQDVVLPAENRLKRKAKPLCRLTDEECGIYAELNNIEYTHAKCPYSKNAIQNKFKEFFNEMEKKNPSIKQQFYFGFLRRMKPLLEKKKHDVELVNCKRCGMPTLKGREVCLFCSIAGSK